jgi:ABC-type nitrate/sulfonate/bicarbonate transport system permease component
MSRTRVVALLGVLVVWAAVSYGNIALAFMNPVLLPTPGQVARVFADTVRDGSLPQHVGTSLARVAVGFGAAAAAALALGLLAAMCLPVRLMMEPIIEFVRPIPPLAFLPMFLVWFGLGEASKVAFIGYTTFFPMFVAIAAGVLRVDVTLLRAAASLGASRPDLILRVIVPSALPGIIVALRLGWALALFVIVGAEFMGADAGLGHLIMEGRTFFVPAQIVMGALVLGLLGSVVNALLLGVERRLFRWREAGAIS